MGVAESDLAEPDLGERLEASAFGDQPDGRLLELFSSRTGAKSESAFAELVARHGPRVLRVCRRVLRDEHEAEDALQVTFLLLAKKAQGLRVNGSIAPWLHVVACRVAADARKAAARRKAQQQKIMAMASMRPSDPVGDDDERAAILYEEIGRLSAKLRAAVVLCDLDGLSHHKAALLLGWPVGTVKSRQSRGRERLRHRLLLRGLAFGTGGLAMMLQAERASAKVAPRLVGSTARAAVEYVSGCGGTAVTAKVIAQAGRASTRMTITRLGGAASVLLACVVAATAAAFVGARVMNGIATPDRDRAASSERGPIPAGSLANLRWNRPGPATAAPAVTSRFKRVLEETIEHKRKRASDKHNIH